MAALSLTITQTNGVQINLNVERIYRITTAVGSGGLKSKVYYNHPNNPSTVYLCTDVAADLYNNSFTLIEVTNEEGNKEYVNPFHIVTVQANVKEGLASTIILYVGSKELALINTVEAVEDIEDLIEAAVAAGDGPAGLDGRTIHNGDGAPDSGLGTNGDFYIDNTSDTKDIYGPKTAGDWGDPFPLKGDQGDAGTDGIDGEDGEDGSAIVDINDQVDSYTLALSDKDKLVRLDKATPVDLTVPKNATVAFPIKSQILVTQYGAGQVTFVPEDGTVTINSAGDKDKTTDQHSVACLIKTGTNEWLLTGDITA